MPNIKSAEKRLRQSLVRRTRNRAAKSTIKTQIRKVREDVAAGDIQKADQDFRVAAQRLDRAGSRNIIHPNKASRLKSRLQRAIKKAKKAPAVAS